MRTEDVVLFRSVRYGVIGVGGCRGAVAAVLVLFAVVLAYKLLGLCINVC